MRLGTASESELVSPEWNQKPLHVSPFIVRKGVTFTFIINLTLRVEKYIFVLLNVQFKCLFKIHLTIANTFKWFLKINSFIHTTDKILSCVLILYNNRPLLSVQTKLFILLLAIKGTGKAVIWTQNSPLLPHGFLERAHAPVNSSKVWSSLHMYKPYPTFCHISTHK